MGWLSKLFGVVSKDKLNGIQLDTSSSYWEVQGPKDYASLFRALDGWLPDDSILYFEGGSPDPEIKSFLAEYSVQEQIHIAMGTIWPCPKVFHVPSTHTVLTQIAEIMEHHSEPELAIHFHVYRDREVLLEWHDAFSQPMLMSGKLPEEKIESFAKKVGTKYRRIVKQIAQGDAVNREL